MKNIPCENCIAFAVCNSQEYINTAYIVYKLLSKCSSIGDYINASNKYPKDVFLEIEKFFNYSR